MPNPVLSNATIISMEEVTTAITWEAPEHHHIEKGNDWYWALGIVAIAGAAAAFMFGNFLLTILVLVAACAMALLSVRPPAVIPFSVSTRGLRIGDTLYPYSTLESYAIDESRGYSQLLVKSKRLYMPLLILPLPEEYVHDIDDLVGTRLPEEELEEPFIQTVLEFFGF